MDFYTFEDSSDLENVPLLNIELTLVLQFRFLSDLFKLRFFLLDASIFTIIVKLFKKINYFWRMLLKLDEKNLEIHRHSWLSIILMFKKVNSIQTFVKDIPEIKLSHWSLLSKTHKKSHLMTQILIALKKFVFYPNNSRFPLRIVRYWESTVAARISSLVRHM